MSILGVEKDFESGSLAITAEFEASVERMWELVADPQQLEQWWGPPGYPATFTEHGIEPGSVAAYYMTGPDGEKYPGWWRVASVDAPILLVVEDGFSDDQGNPDDRLPVTTMELRFSSSSPGRSTMAMLSIFPSVEAMEEVLSMGAEEGMVQALGQIDDILAGSG